MNNEFGEYIKRQRKAMGYSLTRFAELAGFSQSYLDMIEKGQRPPPIDDKIIIMAELLGIHIDSLMYLAHRLPEDVRSIVDSKPRTVTALIRKHMEDGLFNGKK